MLRLLHISDLHLGSGGAWPLGDYGKTELIDESQRLTRHDLLRGTLDALGSRLRATGEELDAIVVSGDVSYQDREDGFEALGDLLQHLGSANPGRARTIVVPGNHDVAWRTPPDSRPRYELFLKHIRETGFVTPLLEGVDISAVDGTDLQAPHNPILDLGDAMLIAVNSSNYCGTLQPLSQITDMELDLLRHRASEEDDTLYRLLQSLEELRLVDVCKVSKGQTEALSNRIREVDSVDGRFRLKVVVLHHQLLPVNVEEEVKPFETMVNLGFFRQWLADNGVHLVLHGHKHSSGIYFDLPGVPPFLEAGERLGQRLITVSSVATANQESPPEIARLIEVDSPGGLARAISIRAVPPTYPKLAFPTRFQEVGAAVVSEGPWTSRLRVFEGHTVEAVYDQLLAAFPADSYEPINDVICRVVDGTTGLRLPRGYPVPDGENPEEWFAETVAWWQNPEPQLVPPQFNHGQRIWRAPHDLDQFALAMKQLQRPGTSRAVIVLVDPQAEQELLYPALCLIQLRIPEGTRRLDCVGYFRKQQMRAWWPINMGELAHLQQKALDHLNGMVPGELLTISAVAIGGSDRPRVAVPRVDRWSQDSPGALWDLVLATLSREHPIRAQVFGDWSRLFSDWRPGKVMERDGVPVALRGIDALADAVETCARRFPHPRTGALVRELRDLSRVTHAYWRHDSALADDARRQLEYDQWRPLAEHGIDRVLEHVKVILAATDG